MAGHMVRDHIRAEDPDFNSVSCHICGKKYSERYIREHIVRVHSGKQKKTGPRGIKVDAVEGEGQICPQCGVLITADESMVHDCTHGINRKKKVSGLGSRRATNKDYPALKPLHRFKCDDCDFTSANEDKYRHHIYEHATWYCALCPRIGCFKRVDLESHLTYVHKRELSHHVVRGACVDRDYPPMLVRIGVSRQNRPRLPLGHNRTPVYKQDGSVYRKMNPNIVYIRGNLSCRLCTEQFTSLIPAKNHLEMKHSEELKFKCAQCGNLAFVNETQYGLHTRKFHAIDYDLQNEPQGMVDSILTYTTLSGFLQIDPEGCSYEKRIIERRPYHKKMKLYD